MSKPVAVVLNMYTTGLGIARNLGRLGVPVVGMSTSASAPGQSSRFCTGVVAPDSQQQPRELLEFLVDFGRKLEQTAVLFPTRDADVRFIDQFRAALEAYFHIPQPSHETLDLILNKQRLAEKTAALGIATPRTFCVHSLEALKSLESSLIFPSVLKPVYAYQWRLPRIWEQVGRTKGIKVGTFEELLRAYNRIAGMEPEALVQEWVPGSEEQFFVLGAYFDRGGSCRAHFTAQKMMQYPPGFGLGCIVRTVHNEEIVEQGVRLLESINFAGLAEVEFKKDSRTGQYSLIEINPRHWDQHTLGTLCGVNLSYMIYGELCGLPQRIPQVQRSDEFRWIGGAGILGSIKEDFRHRRLDWSKLAAVFPSRKKTFALWSWRDPIPFWQSLLRRDR